MEAAEEEVAAAQAGQKDAVASWSAEDENAASEELKKANKKVSVATEKRADVEEHSVGER